MVVAYGFAHRTVHADACLPACSTSKLLHLPQIIWLQEENRVELSQSPSVPSDGRKDWAR